MEPDVNRNNDSDLTRWVDDELATLGPPPEWQPDLQRGLVMAREQAGVRTQHQRKWAWVAAAATVSCVFLVATPVTRAFAQRCVSACVTETGWLRQLLHVGSDSPTPTNAYIQPENRQPAPDFVLADANGKQWKLSDFRGKVVLLNFWATWCAPCRVEIPFLSSFQETYRNRGLVVLGISVDDDGWNAITPFAKTRDINYPLMLAGAPAPPLFADLKTIPTTFILDRQGRIAATHVGLCDRREYEGDMQAVLNGH